MAKTSKKKINKLADALASKLKIVDKIPTLPNSGQGKKKKKKSKGVKFGAVSSITTAPVAIGNSLRGTAKKITNLKNGVLVKGRDYFSNTLGSGSITTWCCVAGSPLTPVAFVDSTVSNLARMYQKFRFKYVVVHYITSSPTSSNGDVLIYYNDNREVPFPNQTSSNFLPFMFSDDSVVMGPQWTNHTAIFNVKTDWKYTDYGTHCGMNEFSCGEVFLFSKTSTTDSPGYLLFDYELEFAEHRVSTRMLTFPITRIQYSNVNLGKATTSVTSGGAFLPGVVGNNISGVVSAFPTGFTIGDIYKVIIDLTNSAPGSWVNCSVANLLSEKNGGTTNAITLNSDGYVCYAVANTASSLQFYSSMESAYTNGQVLYYGVTATVTYNLQCWISFIGSTEYAFNISNF